MARSQTIQKIKLHRQTNELVIRINHQTFKIVNISAVGLRNIITIILTNNILITLSISKTYSLFNITIDCTNET